MFSKQEIIVFSLILIAILFTSVVSFIFGLPIAIGGFFLILISLVTGRFPRTSFYLFLIYLCFGGTITYIIPGVYEKVGMMIRFNRIYIVLQFIKDVFYLPVVISILINHNKILKEFLVKIKPLWYPILGFTSICLMTLLFVNIPEQFNPESPHKLASLMGIIGFKVWLSYIPVMLCTFFFIRNREDLTNLLRLQVILITVCCLCGIIQYLALSTGFCNGSYNMGELRFRTSLQARCLFGGSLLYFPPLNSIRLPGTFVAPWQWGWFLISSTFFSIASAQFESSKKWSYFAWFASFLVLVNAVISGQRIALLLVPIFWIVLFICSSKKAKNFYIALGGVTCFGLISLTFPIVQQAINSFIRRWNYSPPPDFIYKTLYRYFSAPQNWIFGEGLGTTASAARKLGKIRLIEVFPGQLIHEMGFVGLIAFLIMVSFLVFFTWKIYRKIEDKSLQKMAICLWIFVLFISYNIYYYPLNVDPVNIYFWLAAGILFRLPDLDKNQGQETEKKMKDSNKTTPEDLEHKTT